MTKVENKELIAAIARDVIEQVDPTELPLFDVTSEQYFRRPSNGQASRGGMLESGFGEVVVWLTPVVLVVVTEVVAFAIEAVKESFVGSTAEAISDRAKRLFKKFRPEEKEQADNPPPLTLQQIKQVRKLAYERFIHLKLSEAHASRLADAIVATLVDETS